MNPHRVRDDTKQTDVSRDEYLTVTRIWTFHFSHRGNGMPVAVEESILI